MPSATCYFCLINHAKRQNATGKTDDPVGSCYNCQSFACDHHGFRDANIPGFSCVMCDPNLLAASAANVAQSQQPADLDQQVVAGLLNLYPMRAAAWLPDRQGLADFPDRYVRTVEEFLYRRPHYEHLLQPQMLPEPAWRQVEDERLARAIGVFPRSARLLLVAAAVLVRRSNVPGAYPAILQNIADAVGPAAF